MNNAKKNYSNFNVSNHSYILAGTIFAVILLVCLTLFNFVSYFTSGTVLTLMIITSCSSALTGAVLICARYAKAYKIKNPADTSKKDVVYYIKRMGYIAVMMILMSFAASIICTFVNAIVGKIVENNTDSLFLRGFIIKLPMFVLYLSFIYKMFIRYGFADCGAKIYNPNFKMLSVIITLIVMIPNIVFDSMFYTSTFEALIINVQTVLNPNVGRYIADYYGDISLNENFNIFLVFVTVVMTFAIQAFVARFAYKRGRQIFEKEHIRIIDEYEINENV